MVGLIEYQSIFGDYLMSKLPLEKKHVSAPELFTSSSNILPEITQVSSPVYAIIFQVHLEPSLVRTFANCLGERGRVIPKSQKMVLDAALLNTQHY